MRNISVYDTKNMFVVTFCMDLALNKRFVNKKKNTAYHLTSPTSFQRKEPDIL